MNYKFEQKAKVMVTYDLNASLYETLEHEHWKRPFIVIDKFLLDTPIIKTLFNFFDKHGIYSYIYDEVIPEPPMEIVDKGAKLYTDNACDCVIAIGGGSVIDAARGINIIRTHGGKICDYINDKQITTRCHGLIAIPTTSGTGSELSNALVVTDTIAHEKLAVLSDEAVSEYVILNPCLPKSMPKNLTITTGLDVFSHAAEAYTSVLSSPIVDAVCEKIMFLVVKYLPKAVNDGNDLEARERMMVAAALGGWVINNGGTHLGHSIGHIVGAKYHLPHGMACAYALPAVLSQTALVSPKKIKEIGNILGLHYDDNITSQEIGVLVSNGYINFRDKVLGLQPFSDSKIQRDDLLALCNDVLHERFATNAPFELTKEIIHYLLNNYG